MGTERIRGELLKLGIVVSNRSIRRCRWRGPVRPPSQTWRTFLYNHAHHLWAADLFTLPTLTFAALYVLVFIAHDVRELVHVVRYHVREWLRGGWHRHGATRSVRQALGVPVHRLYGGALRQRVPVYASGLCYFPDVDPASYWVEEACDLVERGFGSGIRMRIGRFEPGHELPLIARVRECLPPSVKLMVDGWGSYTPSVALRVGR